MTRRTGNPAGRPAEGRAGTRVRDYPQLSIRLPQTWVDTFNRRARAYKETRAQFLIRLLKLEGREPHAGQNS